MAPCVGERLVKDELTEIPVGNHQNALLIAGKGDRKRDQINATFVLLGCIPIRQMGARIVN
jgi:hypothetical protein